MSNLIRKDGFNYSFDPAACAMCQAKCCTGESGYIYVSNTEAEQIAKFLDLDVAEFRSRFLYRVGRRYSIKERRVGNEYECAFYDRANNGCVIYAHRPSQCVSFPFWERFKVHQDELKQECIGVVFDE